MEDLYGQAGKPANVIMAAVLAEAEAAESAKATESGSLSAFTLPFSSSPSSSSSGTAISGRRVGGNGGVGDVGGDTAVAAGESGRAGCSAPEGVVHRPPGVQHVHMMDLAVVNSLQGQNKSPETGPAPHTGRAAPTWLTGDIRSQLSLTSPIEHQRLRPDQMAHV